MLAHLREMLAEKSDRVDKARIEMAIWNVEEAIRENEKWERENLKKKSSE